METGKKSMVECPHCHKEVNVVHSTKPRAFKPNSIQGLPTVENHSKLSCGHYVETVATKDGRVYVFPSEEFLYNQELNRGTVHGEFGVDDAPSLRANHPQRKVRGVFQVGDRVAVDKHGFFSLEGPKDIHGNRRIDQVPLRLLGDKVSGKKGQVIDLVGAEQTLTNAAVVQMDSGEAFAIDLSHLDKDE